MMHENLEGNDAPCRLLRFCVGFDDGRRCESNRENHVFHGEGFHKPDI